MQTTPEKHFTAFDGVHRLAAGTLQDVAPAVKAAIERGDGGPVLIFNDSTGRPIDIDIRGSVAEVVARYAPPAEPPRGRGRPKLGVVAHEVTLLPRHWDWLSAQPGGASVTLRKLVEEARRANGGKAHTRKAHEAAYHFMLGVAGDLPGFEEATRALFANDRVRFESLIAHWPQDVRVHAIALAFARPASTDD